MEKYGELEQARKHLIEQTMPKDRAMVLAGIDRLLDEMLASRSLAEAVAGWQEPEMDGA